MTIFWRGFRRGDIDIMIGALRDPLPIGDVVQEPLFQHLFVELAQPGHPLTKAELVQVDLLSFQSLFAPKVGTRTRAQFDALFDKHDILPPLRTIEFGSILSMHEILARTNLLEFISGRRSK